MTNSIETTKTQWQANNTWFKTVGKSMIDRAIYNANYNWGQVLKGNYDKFGITHKAMTNEDSGTVVTGYAGKIRKLARELGVKFGDNGTSKATKQPETLPTVEEFDALVREALGKKDPKAFDLQEYLEGVSKKLVKEGAVDEAQAIADALAALQGQVELDLVA